jgi:hypothetical protein
MRDDDAESDGAEGDDAEGDGDHEEITDGEDTEYNTGGDDGNED